MVAAGGPTVVVSVHDVAPATTVQTERWLADLDSLGINASLLVIPGPWRGAELGDAPELAQQLAGRVDRGDEIVLHGWTHTAGPEGSRARRLVGRAVARGAAEFAALAPLQAADRLERGRAALAAAGLTAVGFTPPGWLASPGTVAALRTASFEYVTVHRGLFDLRTGRRFRAFALSHRPGGAGEGTGAALMRAWARRGAGRGALVRVALHPDDLSRPQLRDTTLWAIEHLLGAGARAVTYGQLAATVQ
ncbi:DUF2334 domain-containing protein [Streptomyces sp. NPDC001978]|uniref:DUF2334 domain-containing protein n=1 Tax=Streptomyces sp. NPDC001978 TaxID=3364627 RepID=UPI0036CF4D66